MRPPRILLLASYELGHAPLSVAWPLAFLRAAGFAAEAVDLAVTALPEERVAQADLIGFAAPMHTALRLGVQSARRVRALQPRAHLCFYGLYASLNRTQLFEEGLADSIIAGEYEAPLVALARALQAGAALDTVTGLITPQTAGRAAPHLARLAFPVPDYSTLPALEQYARYAQGDELQLSGYVEASRGCRHTCRHCPIPPVYDGRFFVVPAETVLADIAQQVARGARHITFGDPDFLNGPGHALRVTRALHARWPQLTFDFTTKVEHILQHRALFAELAELGATFVVSAIESVSDRVLQHLDKGHTAADIDAALRIVEAAGLALQPTLVAFTPWTTLDDYLAQIEFIRARGLQAHLAPVQLSIRLLLPPGSLLIDAPDAADWLGDLDAQAFTYRWKHPDPRLDMLYAAIAERVAEAEANGEPAALTFEALRALAYAAAGRPLPLELEPERLRPAPPRLTENWFC